MVLNLPCYPDTAELLSVTLWGEADLPSGLSYFDVICRVFTASAPLHFSVKIDHKGAFLAKPQTRKDRTVAQP